jgi:undecaprenyl-diphosphatase
MNVIQGAVIGVVQGLTEFLPVSSSGHLVLARKILGLDYPLSFDIALHAATLLALIIVMRKDIFEILKKPFSKLTYLIILACIPAFLMGYFLQDFIENIFRSGKTLGIEFILTGIILLFAEKLSLQKKERKEMSELKPLGALLIGTAQGLAILPAVSRSGFTIAGGMFVGLNKKAAIRFSFLVSIPVIAGAAFFDLIRTISAGDGLGIPYTAFIAGLVAAAISGYVAVKFMLELFSKVSFRYFAFYVFIIGIISLILTFSGI